MQTLTDAPAPESQTVTYVVVVHGIGEQRKNETVINVVNRFAEARRSADEDDNRDVLTLGQASGQTGLSKLPVTEQPWMEFDGIPAAFPGPNAPRLEPFLGKRSSTGDNVRFVDLCWSDVMQESIEHVGQEVSLWAKGLVGRLLRKHDDAEAANNPGAQVPLWIRRVLYLLADTLLLVRFAMNFQFKAMKELVFVKFLGDVQLYGEYSRCRGHAVRRFHDMMAKIAATHEAREREQGRTPPRDARYVIIAHSLGSIMSFDALLYASATNLVRRGLGDNWKFSGYLRDDDEVQESHDLSKLDALRERKGANAVQPPFSEKEECELRKLELQFNFLDTAWVQRVQSFVTLGSPIDKYLTIWWLNYRYLLTCGASLEPIASPITHFNYCDELDPVGHNLDVASQTPAYRAVFERCEDVVFNRYAVPGVAHNEYWADQGLFKWILAQGVDGHDGECPRWFRPRAYSKLLLALYSLVPLLLLLGTYASLSLAFQAQGWRTAVTAAAVFSFLGYFGRRLIDLGIWWRQIQRQKSETFWNGRPADDRDRDIRCRAARRFRGLVVATPAVWAALATAALGHFVCQAGQSACSPNWGESSARLALVVAVSAVVVFLLVRSHLPPAYRTQAVDDGSKPPRAIAWSRALGSVVVGVVAALIATRFVLPPLAGPGGVFGHAALIGVLATVIYAYRLYRFTVVRIVLRDSKPRAIKYSSYASHP